MAIEFVGTGVPDGTVLGLSSAEKVGFFGATGPVTQVANITVPDSTNASLLTAVTAILAALNGLGLVKPAS